ncbi:SDR family oxidoreductase [Sphingomonas sp.]|uniref:SDR family oxidoreductase n=1 Tax=Sphingomonas sp. TaxID=28214 RepID=UPI002CABD03D|nr:SDR family oxidoreductase [Sphingomonas sp.]HTG37630.1 SDR family oxidoreductase [Sphingomonas sp.]
MTDNTRSARRTLVTGGTTGIGREIVRALAEQGHNIVTNGRERAPLDEMLALVAQAPGNVSGLTADLATRTGQQAVIAAADATLGGLDILIANAAIGADPLDEMDDDGWRYVIDTNLTGCLAVTRAALERMNDGGDIILVGSISSDILAPGESVYAATKGGIAAFAETLRKEVAKRDIRVTLVQPGSVATDMQQMPQHEKETATAAHEMLHAADVAEAVRWLLSQPRRVDVVTLRIEPRIQSTG